MNLTLFDLDGTLMDTAPDLAAAANAMRAEFGLAINDYVKRGKIEARVLISPASLREMLRRILCRMRAPVRTAVQSYRKARPLGDRAASATTSSVCG